MSNTDKEKAPGVAAPGANTESHSHASIMPQNAEAVKNKSEVIKAINELKDAVDSLQFPDPASAIYSLSDEIKAGLGNIAHILGVDFAQPVIPGGPNDWVIRVYYRDIHENDPGLITQTIVDFAKFPVIYWQGTAPVIAGGYSPADYGQKVWNSYDLVLRNGADISGRWTKKTFMKHWKRCAKFSRAVLKTPSLPSGEDITSVASQCFDEAAGEDEVFPKTYRQFCAALLNKFGNNHLIDKLRRWGYTEEVHNKYVAEFYPEGSYWTVEDWEQNRCFVQDIDTYKERQA